VAVDAAALACWATVPDPPDPHAATAATRPTVVAARATRVHFVNLVWVAVCRMVKGYEGASVGSGCSP
jgi:hypothetical protein